MSFGKFAGCYKVIPPNTCLLLRGSRLLSSGLNPQVSHETISLGRESVKAPSYSFILCLCIIAAIVNAVASFRAESSFVAIGTGIAAFFLLAAAFRAARWRRRENLDEPRRER